MNSFFIFCFVAGMGLMGIQFLMSMLGLDHEHDTHFEKPDKADKAALGGLNLLSIRALSAGLALFGAAGGMVYTVTNKPFLSLFVAVVVGVGTDVLMAYAMRAFTQMESDGSVYHHDALNSQGSVYVAMPNEGDAGLILVNVGGRTLTMTAISEADKPLNAGDPIRVVAVHNDVAYVDATYNPVN